MSQPFYTIDNTRLIIHTSCVVKSARTIAGEHNRSILPSHPPPLNLHQQPPQYMNYDHLALPPPPPPPHNNYVNGNFNVPYPPAHFNLHQQPQQYMNYPYSTLPPPLIYVVHPPPQNSHNNQHQGYGTGMTGILASSVVGAFIQALLDGLLS